MTANTVAQPLAAAGGFAEAHFAALAGRSNEAVLEAGRLSCPLSVRNRRPGDVFRPLGLNGRKKLQDFFVDARAPRDERDAVPIFESERGIVWVGGLRIADWAKPQAGAPTLFLWYEPVTD